MRIRQFLFRTVGIAVIGSGLYAGFDFGRELLPLFESVVQNRANVYSLSIIPLCFFTGVVALVIVGSRYLMLRNFGRTWLYFALIPISVWVGDSVQGSVSAHMDADLLRLNLYFMSYILLVEVVTLIHKKWYVPVSHEKMHYVGLLSNDRGHRFLYIAVSVFLYMALLVLHPTSIGTTIEILLAPIKSFF